MAGSAQVARIRPAIEMCPACAAHCGDGHADALFVPVEPRRVRRHLGRGIAKCEFLRAIELPLPAASETPQQALRLRAYKLSKRYDCDISAVSCGLG